MSVKRPRPRRPEALAGLGIVMALAFSVTATVAQTSKTVDQLAFMTGNWARTTNGVHVEQVFLSPTAGTIVGMQRRTRGDTTLVSYFFIIEETDEGIVCRFKHFENDYTTYEDRNGTGPRTFTLIETSVTAATFVEQTSEGSLYLRYRITDTGRLGVAVGSLADFESNTVAESLHDRVR